MAGHAQNRIEITFNIIFLIISFSDTRDSISFSDTRDSEVRRGFNSQPKILKLHFTQLVLVYIVQTLKFTTLYFNFHLVQKQPFSGDMVDSHSNFSRDLEMLALSTRLVKLRIHFFSPLFRCGQKGAASLSSVMQKSYQSLNISFVKPTENGRMLFVDFYLLFSVFLSSFCIVL